VLDQIGSDGRCRRLMSGRRTRSNGGWLGLASVKDRAGNICCVQGRFCVWGATAFKKRYDLTERVIDAGLCDRGRPGMRHRPSIWCCSGGCGNRLVLPPPGETASFLAHITPQRRKCGSPRNRLAGRIEQVQIRRAPTARLIAAMPVPGLARAPR